MIYRVSKNDPELKEILWTGIAASQSSRQVALLRTAVNLNQVEVFFELVDRQSIKVGFVTKWFTAFRVFSLTATATPALVVLLYGLFIGKMSANLLAFSLSFISVLMLQIAVNVLNDVEDHIHLIDGPGDVGGSGVIQKGWISAQTLARLGYGLIALAILCGLYPLIAHFKQLWPLVLLSLVGAIGYSGAPFRFKYRAFGDAVVFFLCGPCIAYGFAQVTFQHFGIAETLIGTVFGLAATAILHANNLNDLEIDLSRGAKTIANRIGFQFAKRYLAFIYGLIFVALVIAAMTQPLPIWFCVAPFLAAPMVVRLLGKVKQASGPLSPSIAKIRFEAAQIHLLLGLTWLVALVVYSLA
jgi:1,4-dihydroxy-2-naphthoate octaprenyltransferase